MTYTQLAIIAVTSALTFDHYITGAQIVKRKVFWISYAIIILFQLLTNWWLTSRNIVMYNPDSIIGLRIASAPVEDLLYGFALVLVILTNWILIDASERQRQQL